MKTSSEIIRAAVCLSLTILPLAAAGQDEPVGYLRIVNGIAAGSGNVRVRVDGVDVYPKGYRFGAVTGGIAFPPGSHRVEVSREGVTTGKADVTLVKNLTATLVTHAEERASRNGKPPRSVVRLLAVAPRLEEQGKLATFVSVSRNPLLRVDVRNPDGGWRTVEISRRGVAESPLMLDRGYVALRYAGKPLDAISVADSGNYVVVLFDDRSGALRSVSFRDSGELAGD